MIDAENHDRILRARFSSIDDHVRQPGQHHLSGPPASPSVPHLWKGLQEFNRLLDLIPHIARGVRISLRNVFCYGCQMPACARGLPYPHRPNFFQVSAISSSLANSPRSASLIANSKSSRSSRRRPYFAVLAAKARSTCPRDILSFRGEFPHSFDSLLEQLGHKATFQNSFISCSETNSPHSACSSPRRTAARSSSVTTYTPVRREAISRAI
jgi:hypothetical protein